MNKITLIILLFLLFGQLSFAQSVKDDFELYELIFSEQLDFSTGEEKDSIILIEQFQNEMNTSFEVFDPKIDTLTETDRVFIFINTYRDTAFYKRLIDNPELKKQIVSLTSDFKNHPKFNTESFSIENIHFQTITSDKYYSFFKKPFRKKDPYSKIKKKYGTNYILSFSGVNYQREFAAVYYEVHCGGLCGTGCIVIFEKVKGRWKIMTEINLWMS